MHAYRQVLLAKPSGMRTPQLTKVVCELPDAAFPVLALSRRPRLALLPVPVPVPVPLPLPLPVLLLSLLLTLLLPLPFPLSLLS